MSTLFLLALLACTDAERAQHAAFGEPGHITCYSGGQVIYDGDSTGRIESEQRSDGWLFMDAKTRRLVRVSGDCVVRN
jgi:hypothetical protein